MRTVELTIRYRPGVDAAVAEVTAGRPTEVLDDECSTTELVDADTVLEWSGGDAPVLRSAHLVHVAARLDEGHVLDGVPPAVVDAIAAAIADARAMDRTEVVVFLTPEELVRPSEPANSAATTADVPSARAVHRALDRFVDALDRRWHETRGGRAERDLRLGDVVRDLAATIDPDEAPPPMPAPGTTAAVRQALATSRALLPVERERLSAISRRLDDPDSWRAAALEMERAACRAVHPSARR